MESNKILGTWKILHFLHLQKPNYRKYWLVECTNCNFQKKAEESNLSPPAGGGRCQNCWGRPKGYAGFLNLFDSYMRNAKKLSRQFELSKEDFLKITSENCYYCNTSPFLIKRGGKVAKSIWGDYHYNGIDRINNAVGYIISNCVTCCFICNRAKNKMSYDDFVDYIRRVSAKKSKLWINESQNKEMISCTKE